MRSIFKLATAVSVYAITAPAWAQAGPQAALAGEQQGDRGDVVVVTGSRVAQNGAEAPTPLTVMDAETLLQTAPSNIPDALNKLPVFTGSASPAASGTFNAGSRPLGNYLNLRGIGTQRMLVLLDGQRVPPTTNTNAVDTNVLPQMLITNVDVVTGGASAVYGSDAVSGVANFVLDKDYTGLKIMAQGGISDEGDASSYRVGVAYGADLTEQLHLIASYEHYTNDGIPSLYDRDWAPHTGAIIGAGTLASPITVLFDTTRNNQSNGGVVLGGGLIAGNPRGVEFRSDGSLSPYDPGLPTPLASNTSIGGDGGIYAEPRNGGTSIAGSLETDQVFSRVTFDLNDSLTMYAQGSYSLSKTSFNSVPQQLVYGAAAGARRTTIFSDNPYLRPEVRALLTTAGETSFSIGRIFNDIPVVTQHSDTEYVSGQIGFEGDFSTDWSWDANYVFGQATQDVGFNEFDLRRYFASVDAVRNPANGAIVCGVTLTNPTLLPGCVPMNIMGDGNISREAFNYVRRDSTYSIQNQMQYLNFNIQGKLFNLPAGPVQVAAGAEIRHQELEQTSNSDPAIWADPATGPAARAAYFSGIRGVPAAALQFMSINVGLANGKQDVSEAYTEVSLPLLSDVPLAKDLSLDLAARFTDYKTSGQVTTWKASGGWTPFDGVRFRGSQSRDIAAPSLSDLYAGENLVIGQFNDPLTGINATVPTSSSGNPAVGPESADTTTFGVVFQPDAIPGLTFSIDAYRIEIADAIGTQNAIQQAADCHASGGTAPVCTLIDRPFPYSNTTAANFPTKIRVVPQNLAELVTQGIDFEATYTFPVDMLGGDIELRAFVNHLDTYDTQGAASQPVIHRAGRITSDGEPIGLPEWKGLLSQTYSNDRLSLSLTERFTGEYVYGSPTQVFAKPINAPSKVYLDLNATYDFDEDNKVQGFVNVQNLLDTDPKNMGLTLIQNLSVDTDKTMYDVVGRYFTAGVRMNF